MFPQDEYPDNKTSNKRLKWLAVVIPIFIGSIYLISYLQDISKAHQVTQESKNGSLQEWQDYVIENRAKALLDTIHTRKIEINGEMFEYSADGSRIMRNDNEQEIVKQLNVQVSDLEPIVLLGVKKKIKDVFESKDFHSYKVDSIRSMLKLGYANLSNLKHLNSAIGAYDETPFSEIPKDDRVVLIKAFVEVIQLDGLDDQWILELAENAGAGSE